MYPVRLSGSILLSTVGRAPQTCQTYYSTKYKYVFVLLEALAKTWKTGVLYVVVGRGWQARQMVTGGRGDGRGAGPAK